MPPPYPAELPIVPLGKPISATVTVPGSKSITNRALVLAALASRGGPCVLEGALHSEDTEVMVDCLIRLGFDLHADWAAARITVGRNESGRIIPAHSADLYVANSGTTMRFLTAMASLGEGRYRLDGIPRMRERPIRDLLGALNAIPGVAAESEQGTGCPPVSIVSRGWPKGGAVGLAIPSGASSQFLSGVLMAAVFADCETRIEVPGGLVSEPYIRMTTEMVQAWGRRVVVEQAPHNGLQFEVRGQVEGEPKVSRHAIEPDASAASYFWAAAAITGGRVTVAGLARGASLQGDVGFVDALERMGCRVEECEAGITVHGKPLQGIEVDMNAISDTMMTLAAVACFANGPTTIRNVAHVRHKETDRIAAMAAELRKLGVLVDEREEGLTITPRLLTGCPVETYNDHRMAMSLALIGLRVPGVIVRDPGCVAKTYPGFWHDFESLAISHSDTPR